MALGILESVELRELWSHEAGDFTPWLAHEENIDLLGDTIGIDLEVVSQEKSVGPFRADILCKDTLTNHYVLVENQLERTDHIHLGQIITYASGLDAVAVIWIAREFTEEHRAAMDWLNRMTNDEINFFGVEIKAYKIGDSLPAPMFEIVSKPNDWTKSARVGETTELTDAKKLQVEYWTGLREYLAKTNSRIKSQKALPQHWTNFALGRSGFILCAAINTVKNIIRVEFDIQNDLDKKIFKMLKDEYYNESLRLIDESVQWGELTGKKTSWVYLSKEADISNKDKWPEQFEWIKTNLEKFDRYFRPKIRGL